MAEENRAEETTQQESPSVEQTQPNVEPTESAEKQVQTPVEDAEGEEPTQDKNWKAVREELDKLRNENAELRFKYEFDEGTRMSGAKESPAVNPLLSQQDVLELKLNERMATQEFPELDYGSDSYDKLFDIAVSGEYRAELDRYARGMMYGQRTKLPDPAVIAKRLKPEFDKRSAAKKEDVAKKKEAAVEQKQATAEAEGRSDARSAGSGDLGNLQRESRRGNYDAIAERLSRSEL